MTLNLQHLQMILQGILFRGRKFNIFSIDSSDQAKNRNVLNQMSMKKIPAFDWMDKILCHGHDTPYPAHCTHQILTLRIFFFGLFRAPLCVCVRQSDPNRSDSTRLKNYVCKVINIIVHTKLALKT